MKFSKSRTQATCNKITESNTNIRFSLVYMSILCRNDRLTRALVPLPVIV